MKNKTTRLKDINEFKSSSWILEMYSSTKARMWKYEVHVPTQLNVQFHRKQFKNSLTSSSRKSRYSLWSCRKYCSLSKAIFKTTISPKSRIRNFPTDRSFDGAKLFNHVIRFRAKNCLTIFGDIVLIWDNKKSIQDGGREGCSWCCWRVLTTFWPSSCVAKWM